MAIWGHTHSLSFDFWGSTVGMIDTNENHLPVLLLNVLSLNPMEPTEEVVFFYSDAGKTFDWG